MKWILGVVVGTLGLGLVACGSDKPATTQSGVGPTATQPAPAAATVAVAQNPAQGAILVDGQGRTLYLFEKDDGTKSACTGACAQIWPALTAAAVPTAGSGADAALLAVADGQAARQVTYGGHLLYTYSGDAAPGDVKGVSIPGWYPVSPSGTKVDKDDHGGKSGSGGGY
jgi:predicted lipoprotein with Yx(FWY)xxD motif